MPLERRRFAQVGAAKPDNGISEITSKPDMR
jgi:hypothetical protein